MSIKILGGKAKGFSLETPRGDFFRPSLITLKRRLFDWRQVWHGFHFVDLCAGSGGIGFEALSRNVDEVIFCETNKKLIRFLDGNKKKWLEKFPLDHIEINPIDCFKYVSHTTFERHHVLYFDPPYMNHELYWKVINLLKSKEFPGELWIESSQSKGVSLSELQGPFVEGGKVFGGKDLFIVGGKLI